MPDFVYLIEAILRISMTGQRSISLFSTTVALLLVFQLFCTATFAFGLTNVSAQTELLENRIEILPSQAPIAFNASNFDGPYENVSSPFQLSAPPLLIFFLNKAAANVVLSDFQNKCSLLYSSWSAKALPKLFDPLFG